MFAKREDVLEKPKERSATDLSPKIAISTFSACRGRTKRASVKALANHYSKKEINARREIQMERQGNTCVILV